MAKEKKHKDGKKKVRFFTLGMPAIIIIVVTTIINAQYWVEIYDKYQEKRTLDKKLVKLRAKEDELRVDANKLQDPDYIARYAREKYYYSKNGEFILKIPNSNE